MTNIAIENWWFIVDLPINSMVIFHSYVNVYQRVQIMAAKKPGYGKKTIFMNPYESIPNTEVSKNSELSQCQVQWKCQHGPTMAL